jgi:hypothetical protein
MGACPQADGVVAERVVTVGQLRGQDVGHPSATTLCRQPQSSPTKPISITELRKRLATDRIAPTASSNPTAMVLVNQFAPAQWSPCVNDRMSIDRFLEGQQANFAVLP